MADEDTPTGQRLILGHSAVAADPDRAAQIRDAVKRAAEKGETGRERVVRRRAEREYPESSVEDIMRAARDPNHRPGPPAAYNEAGDDLSTHPSELPPKSDLKDTNPKDAVGVRKWRQYCTIPTTIIWELGVAMLEGARKYGRHNYRVAGVRGSVYVDAAKGHIDQWWEGEDIDEESGLSHITKAIASLAVLRDAMIQDKFVDDRPPKTDMAKLRENLQHAVEGIFERIPEARDAYLEGDQHEELTENTVEARISPNRRAVEPRTQDEIDAINRGDWR